jgi:hypothetical protein
MKSSVLAIVTSAFLLGGGIAGAQSIRSDFESFSNGRFLQFSTKGHPKAGAVELSIKYPVGWKIEEGEKPHIVKKMTRLIGPVQYGLMISVSDPVDVANPVSPQDFAEVLRAGDWAESFFPAPAIVHSQTATKFESQPAGMAEVTLFGERLGLRSQMRHQVLVFFSANRMVSVAASVSSLDGDDGDLATKFAEARPLFFSMLNRASLDNVWASPAATVDPYPTRAADVSESELGAAYLQSTKESLDNPNADGFWPAFLIALVLTWTIGPMPAVLIRFAVYRRPLAGRPATIYAVAISVVFWLIGMAIHIETNEKGTYAGVVWIVMYYASKAILRWGASSQAAATPTPAQASTSTLPATPMMAIPVAEPLPASKPTAAPPPGRTSGATKPQQAPIPKIPRLPPPLPPKRPGTN